MVLREGGTIAQSVGHAYTLLAVVLSPFLGAAEPGDRFAGYNAVMTKQALELLQQALALSDEERASLAYSLLDSLDTPADENVEAAWNQEIARRIADLDSGKSKTVPWEEVRAQISSLLSNATRFAEEIEVAAL